MISRNIKSFHAAINPKLVNDKDSLIIKLRLDFPELNIKEIKKKLNAGKYFYLKNVLIKLIKKKFWSLEKKD